MLKTLQISDLKFGDNFKIVAPSPFPELLFFFGYNSNFKTYDCLNERCEKFSFDKEDNENFIIQKI